jgi:hypothetical protein
MKMFFILVLISTSYFFALSGFMGIREGSWTSRDDALFDADITFFEKVLAEPARVRPSPLHPLIPFVWRPLGLASAKALQFAGAGEGARFLAARIVMAIFAGLGIGSLWVLAWNLGVRTPARVALTIVGLLSTSSIISCVPESYGLSFGMLSSSAAVIMSKMTPRKKMGSLVVLSILCAGSTITNGIYPGIALLYLAVKPPEAGGFRPVWLSSRHLRLALIVGGIAGLLAAGSILVALPALGKKFPNFRDHLIGWLHFRIINDPARTIRDWGMGIVYPIVGPYPFIGERRIGFRPDIPPLWSWAHIVAVSAWCGVVILGLVMGLRDQATRRFTLGLVSWVGFNLAIHSVWGGSDNFLYTPHWSWALLAIAFMAAKGPRPWLVVVACAVIIPAQIITIQWIASAALSM